MRELSLHILDLIENAVSAGASRIAVQITQETQWDLMRIVVEDNGPGLRVPAEQALDPFYTTKKGKKTGLGLSLFRFRIEQTGGELILDRSTLGGLAVRRDVWLSRVRAVWAQLCRRTRWVRVRCLAIGEQRLRFRSRRGSGPRACRPSHAA